MNYLSKPIAYSDKWATALLMVFAVISWFSVTAVFGNQGFGDSDKYMAIAEAPFSFTESPWGYRLAVPWMAVGLASISGLSIDAAFQIIQFVSYFLCLYLLLQAAITLKCSALIKVLCPLLFTVGYQYVYYRHNYVHVGMLELFLLGYLVWLLHLEKMNMLLLVLVSSIVVRESVAFVFLQTIVVYWLLELLVYKRFTMSILRLVLTCSAPLLLFISVRLAFTAPEVAATENYLSVYNREYFSELFNRDLLGRLADYVTVYGVLVYIVPVALIHMRSDKLIRINSLVLIFSATQLFLAIDARRMACVGVISLIFMVLSLSKIPRERNLIVALGSLQVLYAVGWLSQNYWLSVVALIIGAAVIVNRYLREPVASCLKLFVR